jgi:hypothetical protein
MIFLIKIANNANMGLKNVNLNGDNIVASNLNKVNLFFFGNCKKLNSSLCNINTIILRVLSRSSNV